MEKSPGRLINKSFDIWQACKRKYMSTVKSTPKNIDEYIAGFPPDVQRILQKIRTTIKKAAPGAQETLKYHMPTFVLNGNLVYFAAFKNHIGFFPPVSGDKSLRNELSIYEGPKGSLKFPLNEPIPYGLIKRIVQIRVKENLDKAEAKSKKG
jgi:uncharacterized protein YdhG (YjbR/CyaY superfamily)